jgi:hypothetical protein
MLDKCPERVLTTAATACVNGMSGEYPCKNVDLLSYVPLSALGSKGDVSARGSRVILVNVACLF